MSIRVENHRPQRVCSSSSSSLYLYLNTRYILSVHRTTAVSVRSCTITGMLLLHIIVNTYRILLDTSIAKPPLQGKLPNSGYTPMADQLQTFCGLNPLSSVYLRTTGKMSSKESVRFFRGFSILCIFLFVV